MKHTLASIYPTVEVFMVFCSFHTPTPILCCPVKAEVTLKFLSYGKH